jgi:hypothetical protein
MGSNPTLPDAQYPRLDRGRLAARDVLRRHTVAGRERGNGRDVSTHVGLHYWILLERGSYDTDLCDHLHPIRVLSQSVVVCIPVILSPMIGD